MKKENKLADKEKEVVAGSEMSPTQNENKEKSDASSIDSVAVAEEDGQNNHDAKQENPLTKKQQFMQFLKFLVFSLSAGFIQLVSFELLYTWTKCLPWWPAYLISVLLSVIWNFTFNRKFTFKSANNVPLAMMFVLIFYAMFIPASVFGGDALEAIGWNGTLVTMLMMIINFISEFFWDKYIVFNEKLMNKILKNKNKDKAE